jgi:hypothetical protein
MTAIHRTWEQRIISGVFTKAQCNQWAKAVYPQIFHEPPQGHHTNLTADEARSLNELLDTAGGVLLTPEHEAQGIKWLRSYGVKSLGLPQGVIDRFHHFSFQGEAKDVSHGNAYRPQYMPVWRIHCTDGEMVDYYNSAWQTGYYPGGSSNRSWWQVLQPT